ncbi:hypothetical protein CABS01_01140 [Colletotrichum abscissum]|nr:uncharacterized protein CABS01_01140 [Colletotrichum abscissum]KAK1505672.1 hypothetical protein CABS01_01140 [Colletotrichum abscissum]KAK1717296.1 hypothetical protein BDP67DRAFT_487687 [Colletotrichum lupini]
MFSSRNRHFHCLLDTSVCSKVHLEWFDVNAGEVKPSNQSSGVEIPLPQIPPIDEAENQAPPLREICPEIGCWAAGLSLRRRLTDMPAHVISPASEPPASLATARGSLHGPSLFTTSILGFNYNACPTSVGTRFTPLPRSRRKSCLQNLLYPKPTSRH